MNLAGNAIQGNPQTKNGRVVQRMQASSSQLTGATLVKQTQLATGTAKLIDLEGYNASASQRYVMLFDTAEATIANGAVPTLVIPVQGNSKALFSWCTEWDFQKGCVIGSSSTETTFTETVTADLFFAVELEIDT